MGGRGQRCRRRRARRSSGCRSALPGRPQRGPHARDRRHEDGAAPDPFGHLAQRRGLLDRQRRRRFSRGALQRNGRAHRARSARRAASASFACMPDHRGVARIARPRAREGERRRSHRHDRPRHRSGLRRTRSRGVRFESRTSSRRNASRRSSRRSSTCTTSSSASTSVRRRPTTPSSSTRCSR